MSVGMGVGGIGVSGLGWASNAMTGVDGGGMVVGGVMLLWRQ